MAGRNNQNNTSHFILLLFFFFFLTALFAHTAENLLRYDEEHLSGQDIAMDIGQENDAQPQKTNWHIIINLDEFRLYVYKDHMVIRIYPCSGGKPATPSPTGDFRVVTKERWGEGFGGWWLGLNVPWGKYGIHGTKYPWIIDKKHCSKGCIRLLSKDAQELAMMIPCGTPVTIIQLKKAWREIKSGDSGSDVRDMEIALQYLLYYGGDIDGKYGDKLYEAVRRFQQENGLADTGKIDEQTHNLIMKLWKESNYNKQVN